jgi:hypothetical protein
MLKKIFKTINKKKLNAKLTIIVCFYDMPREAARTLFTLTPNYQKGV